MSMGYSPVACGKANGQYPIMAKTALTGWRQRLNDWVVEAGGNMHAISVQAGLGETYVRDMLHRGKEPTIGAHLR